MLISASAWAQRVNLDEIFEWTVELPKSEIAQGESAYIIAKLNVKPDHWTYKDMTSIALDKSAIVLSGEASLPTPHTKLDPFENVEKEIYDGENEFRLPITVQPDAAPGVHSVTFVVDYQGCSKTVCYFPQTKTYPLSFTVTENANAGMVVAQQSGSQTITPSAPQSEIEKYLSNSLFLAFIFIFLSGIATCATPCVFPLIPITITLFGAREAKSTFHAFTLALTYVFGLAATYSALGFIAAYTGSLFGQVMSNPLVIGSVATIFIAMGVSMFGAFELQLPSSWSTKLTSAGGKGFAGAFVMGLVAGVIAAPCTGPVLVGLLAYVAKEANPVFGLSLLLVYAFGLGLPFLILGTFSGLITKLPKSGAWMENVKSVFGIMLFTAALYFLKDVVQPLKDMLVNSTAVFIGAAIVFVIGLLLGAVHRTFHTTNMMDRLRKGTGVVLCTLSLFMIFGGLTRVEAKNVGWVHDLEAGLAAAREQNKPVMIDFYADWCTVCKEIEANTFSDDAVGKALNRFVTIKVNLDEVKNKNAIQKKFNIYGLPWITFYDSSGTHLPDETITGFIGPEEFLDHISKIQ
ncbi:MAG: protein-disulfide reductase DsbD [Candidatus Hinthialibacter antarcticus]|nr:protein-disulfide reductase DsbD [Candidatus Hinthialibacter antarcticus]